MEIKIEELYPGENISSIASTKSSNPFTPRQLDEPKEPAKEGFKVIYGLGNGAERMRLLATENLEARMKREKYEKEQADKEAFKNEVFEHYAASSARSSHSSSRATKERRQIDEFISESKSLKASYNKAVDNFDQTCLRVM